MKFRRKRPYEKWPHRSRFTTGPVTGWTIAPWTGITPEGSKALAKTTWYVQDAAYGYRTVASFEERRYAAHDKFDRTLFRRAFHQSAEQAARHYCRLLNRRERGLGMPAKKRKDAA